MGGIHDRMANNTSMGSTAIAAVVASIVRSKTNFSLLSEKEKKRKFLPWGEELFKILFSEIHFLLP